MRTLCLLVCLLAPGAIYADAMATSVCVIEKPKFEALLKEAGTVDKIPTGKLWPAGFCGYLQPDNINQQFDRDGIRYQLLAARRESGTIYSLSVLPTDKAVPDKSLPAQLLCVGIIPPGDGVKKDWGADPFVIVLRSGNFLQN